MSHRRQRTRTEKRVTEPRSLIIPIGVNPASEAIGCNFALRDCNKELAKIRRDHEDPAAQLARPEGLTKQT